MCNSIPYHVDSADGGSVRSLNVSTTNEDPAFWVPAQRQLGANDPIAGTSSAADESLPASPTSPTGSSNSMALSIGGGGGGGGAVPIARTDKHVVLAMNPVRPKMASMQAKLDHTKIDTSLYDNVMRNYVQ